MEPQDAPLLLETDESVCFDSEGLEKHLVKRLGRWSSHNGDHTRTRWGCIYIITYICIQWNIVGYDSIYWDRYTGIDILVLCSYIYIYMTSVVCKGQMVLRFLVWSGPNGSSWMSSPVRGWTSSQHQDMSRPNDPWLLVWMSPWQFSGKISEQDTRALTHTQSWSPVDRCLLLSRPSFGIEKR